MSIRKTSAVAAILTFMHLHGVYPERKVPNAYNYTPAPTTTTMPTQEPYVQPLCDLYLAQCMNVRVLCSAYCNVCSTLIIITTAKPHIYGASSSSNASGAAAYVDYPVQPTCPATDKHPEVTAAICILYGLICQVSERKLLCKEFGEIGCTPVSTTVTTTITTSTTKAYGYGTNNINASSYYSYPTTTTAAPNPVLPALCGFWNVTCAATGTLCREFCLICAQPTTTTPAYSSHSSSSSSSYGSYYAPQSLCSVAPTIAAARATTAQCGLYSVLCNQYGSLCSVNEVICAASTTTTPYYTPASTTAAPYYAPSPSNYGNSSSGSGSRSSSSSGF